MEEFLNWIELKDFFPFSPKKIQKLVIFNVKIPKIFFIFHAIFGHIVDVLQVENGIKKFDFCNNTDLQFKLKNFGRCPRYGAIPKLHFL